MLEVPSGAANITAAANAPIDAQQSDHQQAVWNESVLAYGNAQPAQPKSWLG